jgi:hypothetical protein
MEPWSDQEILMWKEFWDSDMGKVAVSRIKAISDDFSAQELQTIDQNLIVALAGRRAGVEAVLNMITVGLLKADELNKKKDEEEIKGKDK